MGIISGVFAARPSFHALAPVAIFIALFFRRKPSGTQSTGKPSAWPWPETFGKKGKQMKTWATAVFLLLSAVSASQAADNMKAFPPAADGMVRYVLQLPQQADESGFRVELIVGKTVETDRENRYFFGGRIEEETIKGWGFPRYTVGKLGPMAGTLMAVDPGAAKVARFITLGGAPYLIRYNSGLPVVVYVPEGVEVRYRIWTAGAEVKVMEKG